MQTPLKRLAESIRSTDAARAGTCQLPHVPARTRHPNEPLPAQRTISRPLPRGPETSPMQPHMMTLAGWTMTALMHGTVRPEAMRSVPRMVSGQPGLPWNGVRSASPHDRCRAPRLHQAMRSGRQEPSSGEANLGAWPSASCLRRSAQKRSAARSASDWEWPASRAVSSAQSAERLSGGSCASIPRAKRSRASSKSEGAQSVSSGFMAMALPFLPGSRRGKDKHDHTCLARPLYQQFRLQSCLEAALEPVRIDPKASSDAVADHYCYSFCELRRWSAVFGRSKPESRVRRPGFASLSPKETTTGYPFPTASRAMEAAHAH